MPNHIHDYYKQFLQFALTQGVDLDEMQDMYDRDYESNGFDAEADHAVADFEALMYDFVGVSSADDDPRVYWLLDSPGSYEINHPNNFDKAA